MERSVAIKKLSKLLGKSLGYRVNAKAATREEREAAKLELSAAVAERNNLKAERDARYVAILAADQEYQALHAAHTEARDRVSKLNSVIYSRKFAVGTSNGMFFHIKAEGDSWEEVIDRVQAG